MKIENAYGKELLLDIHNCDVSMFNREEIDRYFQELCDLIDMEKCERFWWDDLETPEDEKQTSPHTKGMSAVQFILTSNITIHSLDILEKVFVSIFSCKDFDSKAAGRFTADYFKGKIVNSTVVVRE